MLMTGKNQHAWILRIEQGDRMKERLIVLSSILTAIFAILMGCSTQPVTKKETTPLAASSTVTTESETSTANIALAHPEIPRITSRELKALMDKKTKIAIVDTRGIGAWEAEHIPGSCCIPPADPSIDADTRRDQVGAFAPDTLIVTYCDCEDDSGSASLALELLDLRYAKNMVKILRGGLIDWKKMGYSVASGYPNK